MNTVKKDVLLDIEIINKFLERRKNNCYKTSTLRTDKFITTCFYNYCILNSIDAFNLDTIFDFIEKRFNCSFEYNLNVTSGANNFRACLLKLYFYSISGNYKKVSIRKSKYSIPKKYELIFNEYINAINNGLDITTINNKKVFLKLIFTYLNNIGINDITQVRKNHLYNFLLSCKSKYSLAYYSKIASFVREFVNWLYEKKILDFNGTQLLPMIKAPKQNTIPTTYTREEIKSMLDAVNINTKAGKRDYLVLNLLVYYGLRIGDIVCLKFNNFDFNNNKIVIIQKKTSKKLELPLLDVIKLSFIDYVKNARPSSKLNNVFITFTSPHNVYDKRSFRDIPGKYLNLAGVDIKNKKHGPHSLRHSIASNLLENDTGINNISNILGHTNIFTTSLYLTIDQKQLKELSLEVPLWK